MIRKWLQKILTRPVINLANRFSSNPDKEKVFKSLTALYKKIKEHGDNRGFIIPFNNSNSFIIFSDQHKGAKNDADDFALAEKNYLAALDYYYQNNFLFINLGDCEELWENNLASVKKNNTVSFEKEKAFITSNRFIKIFGNHDLFWDNDPFAAMQLESIYGQKVKIYEGIILQTDANNNPLEIYLTHGHQGDLQSDGNWFSKWFVANIWARLQAYLRINPNTPAFDVELKTMHNKMMYEWSSSQENILLVTGHTHQPVFESVTHLERLYQRLNEAKLKGDIEEQNKIKSEISSRLIEGDALPDLSAIIPSYFNSGCCCFNDGDITGIEISNGIIRLVKWEYDDQQNSKREVLEEAPLTTIAADIAAKRISALKAQQKN